MKDGGKRKEQLIGELATARKRLVELESLMASQQRVEEALQESQHLLRLVLDAIPVGIFWKDRHLNYLGCNERFARDAGLDAPAKIIGRSDYDMPWKDQADDYRQDDREVIQTGAPKLNYEERQTTAEGNLIWLRTSKIPLLDALGEITGVLGTYEDITEWKHTVDAMRESQRHFADIIDFLHDATFVINREGIITSWNHAIEEMTGVTSDMMVGRGGFEHAIPFYGCRRPMLIDLILSPQDESGKNYPFLRREKDLLLSDSYVPFVKGRARYLAARAAPIYNIEGKIVGAIESFRDLTEQKNLEKALAEEHQQTVAILDGSPVSTFVINRDHKVIIWNLANEFFTGLSKKDMVDKPINLKPLLKHRPAPSLAELVLELADDEILNRYGKKGVHKSEIHPEAFETIDAIWIKGEQHNMAIQATRLRDAEGRVMGAIQCAEDITDRMRAEEEIQQAKEKLEQWVGVLEQRNLEMNLLRQMGDILHTCDAFSEAYAVIKKFLPQLFPETSGAVFAFTESRRAVESVVVWGDHLQSELVFAPEDCWALRRGQIHIVIPTEDALRCRHVAPDSSSEYLGVPMLAAGELMGLLHLAFAGQSGCGQRAQELALIVAEHLSLSLSNLRLRDRLREQSIRDPLTGLFNRRYMEESLERELHRAARNQGSLTTMMLDIDHFKIFNDTYGHEAGDDLLKELGKMLKKSTRGGDIACRFGGEEFVIILPEANIAAAYEKAERIRASITSLRSGTQPIVENPVTASLGIAAFPEHGSSVGSLLRAADDALYEAKRKGRNRVEIAVIINK